VCNAVALDGARHNLAIAAYGSIVRDAMGKRSEGELNWKQPWPELTSISLPVLGGGISWSKKRGEKAVTRDLVIDLQERRVLFQPAQLHEEWVNQSILWIRERLSEALKQLADGSVVYRLIAQLRDACNGYLTTASDPRPGPGRLRPHLQVALDELRESFRVTLQFLGEKGDLLQATDLAREIPHDVRTRDGVGRPKRENG
jgi:hypothetical protein